MAAAMKRRTRASEVNSIRPQNIQQNSNQQSYGQQIQAQRLQQSQVSPQTQSMNPMMTLLNHDKKINNIEKLLQTKETINEDNISENISENISKNILKILETRLSKLETFITDRFDQFTKEIESLKQYISTIEDSRK